MRRQDKWREENKSEEKMRPGEKKLKIRQEESRWGEEVKTRDETKQMMRGDKMRRTTETR